MTWIATRSGKKLDLLDPQTEKRDLMPHSPEWEGDWSHAAPIEGFTIDPIDAETACQWFLARMRGHGLLR